LYRDYKKKEIGIVYIDGSNYGRLAKILKKRVPSCKVITFFHNVEARFFWGSFKHKPSFKAAGVLLANFIAEYWATKHSDRIICMNDRDSQFLYKLYGRAATDINPMCIGDKNDCNNVTLPTCTNDVFGLFVGGAFYANLTGVRWFAKNVSHFLPCSVVIVGRGFEAYISEFAKYKNIKIIGMAEDIEEWYKRATFVIAPIFDGSGMKTKVAEALMFGRPVIGTSEAFVGYEDVTPFAGVVCNSADDFVTAITEVHSRYRNFDPIILRSFFDGFYSFKIGKKNLAKVFDRLH
jgi:glycosyltransferase involved in cell wall biosynthesis